MERRKHVMFGLDYARDKNWRPVKVTRKGAYRLGMRSIPRDLKTCGFQVVVADCGDYYRVSYGKQV